MTKHASKMRPNNRSEALTTECKQPPNTKADKDCSSKRIAEQSTIKGRTDSSTLVKDMR